MFEEPAAFNEGQAWSQWGANPGKTEWQKRAYRSFQKRMQKRIWVSDKNEAGCVVAFSNLQT